MAGTQKCTSCGAVFEIIGKKRNIRCPYCDTLNTIERQKTSPEEIVCPKCGSENPLQADHCSECGTALFYLCPKCQTKNNTDSVHCIKCGVNLINEIASEKLKQYQQTTTQDQQIPQTVAKKKKTGFIVIIVIIVVFVCICGSLKLIDLSGAYCTFLSGMMNSIYPGICP